LLRVYPFVGSAREYSRESQSDRRLEGPIRAVLGSWPLLKTMITLWG